MAYHHTGNPWKAIIERDVLAAEDFLLITHSQTDDITRVVAPLVLEPQEYGLPVKPTFTGRPQDFENLLQALLDAAWARGMRPKGYEGPQETKAITRHLEDMRAIVFAQMEVKAP